MDKNTQKRNRYNTTAIKFIAEKYSVTSRYVRQSITGDRKGIFPDKLKKEYNALSTELENNTSQTINNYS